MSEPKKVSASERQAVALERCVELLESLVTRSMDQRQQDDKNVQLELRRETLMSDALKKKKG